MILRFASLLSVVFFFQLLILSVKISHVFKYYTNYVSTNFRDTVNPVANQEYDFIVVGSGSAGAVVANRLSKYNKVLLIEAGGTPFYANYVPMMAANLVHVKEVDYMYKTVPQKDAAQGQIEKGVSNWPRGKLLGGSSNLNYMMYVRAHPFDYDNWANLTKDDSWSYKNLLPHFKRSINYRGKYSSDDVHYGYSYGTQQVEAFPSIPLHSIFMKAGKELGFETDLDLNGPQRSGFGTAEVNHRQGSRESSYTAFIEPILHRENLVISKYSQAVKLHLDKSNRVVGVWYVQHGKRKYAKARKEVIVSAGSIDSPKLLMLSGIGPQEHLKELGIKPRVNLPVGQNLKDHVMTFLMPFTTNVTVSIRPDRDLGINDLIDYYTKGTGHFVLTLGSIVQTFFTSDLAKKESGLDWTDFQMLIVNLSPHETIPAEFSKMLKIRQEILEELYRESVKADKDGFVLTMTLGRPKSVGSITLASKDPSEDPIIDPKYLDHPDDISRFVKAVKFAMKMVETTKAFQELDAQYTDGPIDDCKMHKFKSDKYWECYLRLISLTMYHPVSTCKMGSGPQDKTSVVDSKLRVLHTKGLRVADASIMPDLVNGNTNAPSVLIGEKGADIIREHWAQQYLVCPKLQVIPGSIWSRSKICFYSRLP